MKTILIFTIFAVVAGCGDAKPATTPTAAATSTASTASTSVPDSAVPLAAGSGPASFDFIAYEPGRERIWIPYTRGAGFVDVYDIATHAMTHLTGFGVKESENDGKKRVAGPSAVAIGAGVAYVGDRGTGEICPVDLGTLKSGECFKLPDAPDCIIYVPSTKELWVTTPKTNSIAILDAASSKLAAKTTIKVDGAPEGYALDDAHGFFLTNLEDKNRTLRIDLKTHAVTSNWAPGCSDDGPRGLQADSARGLVIVACTDRVQVLDSAKDGAVVGTIDTGGGVDDVFYAANMLYIGAGKAAKLTVARIDDGGKATVVSTTATVARARNAVADAKGTAYLIDPAGPRLLIYPTHNRSF